MVFPHSDAIDDAARRLTGNAFRLKRDDPDAPQKFLDFVAQSEQDFMQIQGQQGAAFSAGIPAAPVGDASQTLVSDATPSGPQLFTPLVNPQAAEEFGRQAPGLIGDVAGPLFGAAAEITTPADLALMLGTAGVGAPAAAALRTIPKVGRIAAPLVEPFSRGFGRSLAAEAAVGTGAVLGAKEGAELGGTPGAIVGGLAGGVATAASPAAARRIAGGALRAGEQAAEAIGRTGVGNVLDPVPARQVAARAGDDIASRREALGFVEDNPVTALQREGITSGRAFQNATQNVIGNRRIVTGRFDDIDVPVESIRNLPGSRGEESLTGAALEEALRSRRAITESIAQRGFDPSQRPLIGVEPDGTVNVIEGNQRIAAAAEAGLETIPVEVRYFGGSETIPDVFDPSAIQGTRRSGVAARVGGTVDPEGVARAAGDDVPPSINRRVNPATIDPRDATFDEITEAIEIASGDERRRLISILGSDEEAARFERLDRMQDSVDEARAARASAELDEMLTEEQERLIAGHVSQPEMTEEALKDLQSSASFAFEEDAGLLTTVLANRMGKLSPEKIQRLLSQTRQEAIRNPDVTHFVAAREATTGLRNLGLSNDQIFEGVVSKLRADGIDDADIDVLIGEFIGGRTAQTPPTTAIQPPVSVTRAADDVPSGETIKFIRNTEPSPNLGSRFGQDVEPSGRYITEAGDRGNVPLSEGFEAGEVTFQNPLRIPFGEGYESSGNWKRILSQQYGATGEELSQRLVDDGFDGIITTLPDGTTSEIVDLTGFTRRATPPRPQQAAAPRVTDEAARLTPEQPDAALRAIEEATPIAPRQQLKIRQKQPVDAVDPAQASVIDDTISQAETEDITRLNQQLARGGNPPPRKPGDPVATGGAPPPRGPDNALELDLDIPVHEKPQRAMLRRFSGARNEASLQIEEFARNGNRFIERAGVNPKSLNEANMRPVFEVLHGERQLSEIPSNLHPIVQWARRLRDTEQRDMLKFLENAKGEGFEPLLAWDVRTLADRMMAIPDYFPRLWKQPEEGIIRRTGDAGFARTPSAARSRVDSTFSELLDAGHEPRSWNPITMMAMRRMEGVMYREQVKLANNLRRLGKMMPASEAPEAWRVPEIKSPVFEGKPVPNIANATPEQMAAIDAWIQSGGRGPFPGEIVTTPRLAVPNEVADQLEQFYGQRMKGWLPLPGDREIDVFRLVDDFTNATKRIAVFGSWFQHLDILRRGVGARFANVAGIPNTLAMKDVATSPNLLWKLMKLQWIPNERVALRRRFLRDQKIVDAPNSPTWRQVVQEGLEIQGDTSFIQRDALQALDETARSSSVPLAGKALENYRTMRDFLESGLFDGVYRGGMEDSVQRFLVPDLVRKHPDWTPRQIAAQAAISANEIYSALGPWQTVLRNPNLRQFMRWLIFSTNESETLIRQAVRAMNPRDPNGRIWRKFFLGVFMALAIEANVKNLIATGEPLPPESYIPIEVNDPYAHIFGFKTGVGYNGRFLSPQVPFVEGRNGLPIYDDVVGQMDTAIRWATDPTGSLGSRLNRLPAAIRRQDKQETFMGQPLDTPIRKNVQLALDLALPWSVPGALEILISKFPQFRESVPIGESRIGTGGQLLQSLAGFNVRSLNNLEIDEALKSGELNGVPLTQEDRINFERELEVREEERKRKGFTISGKPEPDDTPQPRFDESGRRFVPQ